MLPHLALAALVLVSTSQSAKHTKKAKPTVPPAATTQTTAPAGLPKDPGVVREAPCVLALKGSVVRQVSMLKGGKGTVHMNKAATAATASGATNQTTERFDYEFPGTLQEESDPNGTVRFRFKPATDLVGEGGRASLHLEDTTSGPGGTPVVVDASEIAAVQPFVFEAAGRGMGILPTAGQVYLRGRLQGPLPPGTPMSMEAPVRPVISVPLPAVPKQFAKNGTAAMRFQGLSLWAWPNSKGAFTVAATQDYQLQSEMGSLTGSVEVTFRVGATESGTSKK